MGILDYIEKIQKKPVEYRYKVLFVCTFLTMMLIIVLWLTVSFLPSMPQKEGKAAFFGPLSGLKEDFKQLYDSIKK